VCIATAYKHSGFIGVLIVDKPYRNQGVGKALMETCISYLSAKNLAIIFLDGVQKAVPLYQDLGFEPLYRSLRLFGQIEAQESLDISQMTSHDLEEIFILDHTLFGDDRSFFLRKRLENYPELAFVKKSDGKIQSYIFGRVGRAGWVTAGPWGTITENENHLLMISHFQSKIGNQPFSIGILEPRTSVIKELVLAGMHPRKDPPIRMKLGSGPDLNNHNLSLAIGSPAKG
jgi:ribosomal protein S18 acetylase RimI-like enzyme